MWESGPRGKESGQLQAGDLVYRHLQCTPIWPDIVRGTGATHPHVLSHQPASYIFFNTDPVAATTPVPLLLPHCGEASLSCKLMACPE